MTNPLDSCWAENGLCCFRLPGQMDFPSFLHWVMDGETHDHRANAADDAHAHGKFACCSIALRVIGSFAYSCELYIMFAKLQMRQIVAAASGQGLKKKPMPVFSRVRPEKMAKDVDCGIGRQLLKTANSDSGSFCSFIR